MSEREEIIETMARGIEPVLFGSDAHKAHMAASPYKVDFAKSAVRDRVSLALAALQSAGYVIVKREAIKDIAVRIERQALASSGYAISDAPRKHPNIPTATEVSITHFIDMAGELRMIAAQEQK